MNLRCFPLPSQSPGYASDKRAFKDWLSNHPMLTQDLTEAQQQALANLIPLLLCGEQSATYIFNAENKRLADNQQCNKALMEIEDDEYRHESALQQALAQLPKSPRQHRIKRQSQLFYAGIQSTTQTIANHFYSISQLDACVCILMNTVANSNISGSALSELFHLIKKDEARHVTVARHHALALDPDIAQKQTIPIQQDLVALLENERESFQQLGIDTSLLFERLQNSGLNPA